MIEGIPAPATTVYRARRVITMTGEEPEAFAVLGGRLVATGGLADLRGRFPGAEVVDLGDGVVAPGFNDAHMHLAMAAEDLLHLDLSADAVRSLAELKARVGEQARRQPPETWIRGSRYDDGKMAEGRPLQAARAAGEDAHKGRLAPGQLADFVVLGGDPLTADPGRLGSLPVRATYVGGHRVWPAG
jgi:predicted amidohydrolase YtcJ